MKTHHLSTSLALTCLFLSVQALPNLLGPKHEAKEGIPGPRDYSIYETTTAVSGYTYGGYGPAPTVTRSTTSSSLKKISVASEETSSTVLSYISSSTEILPTVESTALPSVPSTTSLSTSNVVLSYSSPSFSIPSQSILTGSFIANTDSTTAPTISSVPEQTEISTGPRSSTAGSSSLSVSLTMSAPESTNTLASSDIGNVSSTSAPPAETGQTTSIAVGIATSLHSMSTHMVYTSSSSIATQPSETASRSAEISGQTSSSAIGIATSLHSTPTTIVYETASASVVHSSSTPLGLVATSSPGIIAKTSLTSKQTASSAIGITSSPKSSSAPFVYGTTSLSPSKFSKTSSQSIEISLSINATETSPAPGETTSSAIGIATSLQSSSKPFEYGTASSSPLKVSGTYSTKPTGAPTHGDTISLLSSVFATDSPAPTPLKCNHNNCLRQMIRSSTLAAGFCVTYKTSKNTATTGLPEYVSACKNSPSEISSACSCLGTVPLTSVHVSSTKSGDIGTAKMSTGPLSLPISVSTRKVTKTIEITETITTDWTTITTTSTLGINSSIVLPFPSPSLVVTAPSSASLGLLSYQASPSAPYHAPNSSMATGYSGAASVTSSEASLSTGIAPTAPVYTSLLPYPTSNSSAFLPTGSVVSSSSAIGITASRASLSSSESSLATPVYSSASYAPLNTSTYVPTRSMVSTATTTRIETSHTSSIFLLSSSLAPYPILNATSSNIPARTGYSIYSSSSSGIAVLSSAASSPYAVNSSSSYVGPTGTSPSMTIHITSVITSVITLTVPASSVKSSTPGASGSGASGIPPSISVSYYPTSKSISLTLGAPGFSTAGPVTIESSDSGMISTSQSTNSAPYPMHNSTSPPTSTLFISTVFPSTMPSAVSAPYLMSNASTVYLPTETSSLHSSTVSGRLGTSSLIGISTSISPVLSTSSALYPTHNTPSVVGPTYANSVQTVILHSSPAVRHSTSSDLYAAPFNTATTVGPASVSYSIPLSTESLTSFAITVTGSSSALYATPSNSTLRSRPTSTCSYSIPASTGNALVSSKTSLPTSLVSSVGYYMSSTGSSTTLATVLSPNTSCNLEHGSPPSASWLSILTGTASTAAAQSTKSGTFTIETFSAPSTLLISTAPASLSSGSVTRKASSTYYIPSSTFGITLSDSSGLATSLSSSSLFPTSSSALRAPISSHSPPPCLSKFTKTSTVAPTSTRIPPPYYYGPRKDRRIFGFY